MSRILFLVNHDVVIYNFRRELVERLLSVGHEVIISSPYGERIELLKAIGCKYVEVKLDRHGLNPLKELKLLTYYKELVSVIKPDMIFSYTIKPNLYGAMAAAVCKVPIVVNITGLGNAVESGGVLQKAIVYAYRYAFKRVKTIFVQNEGNKQFFIDNNIEIKKIKQIPGSGVNLKQWSPLEYPYDDSCTRFLFVGRLMRDKGVAELVHATKQLKERGMNLEVELVGFCEEDYKKQLNELGAEEYVTMHGQQTDIVPYLSKSHAVVLPSYHEGMANVLLEAAASARPILASKIPGCQEIFDEGRTGIGFESKNTESLVLAMHRFMDLPLVEKRQMGLLGRLKMEKEFNRSIVVDEYMNELKGNEV